METSDGKTGRPTEALVQAALVCGFITPDQLKEALSEQARSGLPLDLILLTKGLIKPEQLREIRANLSPQAEHTLAAGKSGPETEGSILPDEVRIASADPKNDLGKYVLIQRLGRGGMGEVWKAWEKGLRRLVAVKFLLGGSEEDRRRMLREARVAAKLEHSDIVPLYETGESARGPYLAMKLVEGETLDKVTLTLRQKLQAVRSAALAIDYAHRQGVIHRDIKPQNILVEKGSGTVSSKRAGTTRTKADEPVKVYVMDFGLAKQQSVETSLSTSGVAAGTPQYMPPEQARGRTKEIDARSDVWSLGATLYQQVTGVPPFQGDDLLSVLDRVVKEDPLPPSRLNPGLPKDVQTLTLKCLEKERDRRYGRAEDLAEDIRRYLEGEPIAARPATAVERGMKWARRHPAAAALSFAVGALFISLGTGFFWIRAEQAATARQRDRAVAAAEAERKAKETAQARESETQAVLRFVQDKVIAAARPEGQEGGLGRGVTLRRALEASVPFVERGFAGQPLIEARLRMTLGESFSYLGEEKLAFEQFQAARALYARHLGSDHPETILSRTFLASCCSALGRHSEALKLNEETLALRKARLGPDHPDTLVSMNNLAVSYGSLGRHAEALKLHEETLALRKARLGPDHPETLWSMSNLANSYHDLGRHAEALKLSEEVLALQKARLGPDHPGTLVSMNNLAMGYSSLGRHAEALKLHEETLALERAKLGPDHPDTLISMWSLAFSLVMLDRGAEAVPLIDEGVRRAAGKAVPPDLIPRLVDLRLRYFQKTRDPAGCRATAEMWENVKPADAVGFYNAACMRSVTAAVIRAADSSLEAAGQAEAEAGRAMEWLKRAVEAGYRDAAHINRDGDLEALHGRQDFKSLVAEMGAGRQKGTEE